LLGNKSRVASVYADVTRSGKRREPQTHEILMVRVVMLADVADI
jgi:hypothetical protein